MTDKNLYIIAGCNGAWKTTVSFTILPEIINCREFVNADEIAKGLSPFQPEKVAFEAGRIMLNRINVLLKANESFAFETTLSTRSYKHKIVEAKEKGYTVTLLFFWLQNIELAKERVKIRVSEGGIILNQRLLKGDIRKELIICLAFTYPVDGALIFDNSNGKRKLLAQKIVDGQLNLIDETNFNELTKYYNHS